MLCVLCRYSQSTQNDDFCCCRCCFCCFNVHRSHSISNALLQSFHFLRAKSGCRFSFDGKVFYQLIWSVFGLETSVRVSLYVVVRCQCRLYHKATHDCHPITRIFSFLFCLCHTGVVCCVSIHSTRYICPSLWSRLLKMMELETGQKLHILLLSYIRFNTYIP